LILLLRNKENKYGKRKENYPFYASWLGIAVSEVDRLIDNLEAKGFLGHNFFALNNLFYWFIVFVSALFALLPKFSFILFIFVLLFAAGVSLLGPQIIGAERRALGIILSISALAYFRLISKEVFLLSSAALILALVAIYFAYKDEEYLSALFASFYIAGIYSVSRHAVGLQITPFMPLALAFLTFFFIALDLYLKGY